MVTLVKIMLENIKNQIEEFQDSFPQNVHVYTKSDSKICDHRVKKYCI